MTAQDTLQRLRSIVAEVTDPEIPVLTISDLGILRDLQYMDDTVEVTITPTYTGCPAMDRIAIDIRLALAENGYPKVKIISVLSPAWTTDWMTQEGKEKLQRYGIAPPNPRFAFPEDGITCPHCRSDNTRLVSAFSSTACKALLQCNDCLEPFDYFKCH
jgi:ring-1,2-phenylacetyl-CoA epoxidase subunit PaaD